MKLNRLKGVVKVLSGVLFTKKGKPLTTFREALKAEADCGCGIDCCESHIVLYDQSTQELVTIAVVDGAVVVTPKD